MIATKTESTDEFPPIDAIVEKFRARKLAAEEAEAAAEAAVARARELRAALDRDLALFGVAIAR
jgi:hypothetical protein